MKKPDYKVEYHLIAVAYLSAAEPSHSGIARLWESLAALGDLPAEMSYCCLGGMPVNLKKSRVGAPALSAVILEKSDRLNLVSASSFKRNARNAILDSDLNFGFHRDGRWEEDAPPALDLSISGQLIEEAGSQAVLEIVRLFFEVADASSATCGLVDLARPEDAFAGMVYGTTWPMTAPFSRWVEMISWIFSGSKKGDRLRGLYWGNYLGPEIVSRLGGRQRFMEILQQNARYYDGTPSAHLWEFTHGLLVSLSLDPQTARPGLPCGMDVAAQENMKWLVRELGASGVLNQW